MRIIVVLSFIFLSKTMNCEQEGICRVTIADLLKQSAKKLFPDKDVVQAYKDLSMGDTSCKREYQLLYNEHVEILYYDGLEACVRVPHIIYYDNDRSVYDNVYWTLSSNIISLDELALVGITGAYLPSKISFIYKQPLDKQTVALREPFIHGEYQFSAGTRFKIEENRVDCATVNCFFIDRYNVVTKVSIPKNKVNFACDCFLDARIADFILLLKQWANRDSGFIPYVYSGSSFLYTCLDEHVVYNEEDNSYHRPEMTCYPKAGFDCSCIISRASQICNLPYFYKDSMTIEKNLKTINPHLGLQAGDIIWFPGHVVIVSDLQRNLVIEARGYAAGFGKIHELPIDKMFEGIDSLASLQTAFFQQKPLRLLAADGSLRYEIPVYKLLSFKSGLYKRFAGLCKPRSCLNKARTF